MEQTELREQLIKLFNKAANKTLNYSAIGFNRNEILNLMEEGYYLNRSVPTKELKDITDDEIEKEALTQSSELFPEKEKHFRTSNHYDGFKAGAKWMRDKLPITLDLPESKNVMTVIMEQNARVINENSALEKQLIEKDTRIQEVEGKLKEVKSKLEQIISLK